MALVELCREEKSFQVTRTWRRVVKADFLPIQFGLLVSHRFPAISQQRALSLGRKEQSQGVIAQSGFFTNKQAPLPRRTPITSLTFRPATKLRFRVPGGCVSCVETVDSNERMILDCRRYYRQLTRKVGFIVRAG